MVRKLDVWQTPWDEFDGYLFDIDGTLINCTDAVHYFAFCDALKQLSGMPLTLEGVTAHGNTDVGILRDALKLAGIPEDEWRPRLPTTRDTMCEFVEAREDELCVTLLPAVHVVLQHLTTCNATLGLATGNLKRIGQAKLRRAGILDYFSVGGWSDQFEDRTDVFRGAVAQMHQARSTNATICILGDTPADILAAHANRLPVIAVATGVYSREQLLRHKPELCLNSFEDLFV